MPLGAFLADTSQWLHGLPVEDLTKMVSNYLGPSNPSQLEMVYLVPPQVLVPSSVLLGTLPFSGAAPVNPFLVGFAPVLFLPL